MNTSRNMALELLLQGYSTKKSIGLPQVRCKKNPHDLPQTKILLENFSFDVQK